MVGGTAVRAVVTRVTRASVSVDDVVVGAIDEPGLLVLLGVTHSDGTEQVRDMARKLHELRLLRDEQSCATTGAPLLLISQFTLYGDTRKGRRPSWTSAARPEQAEPLIARFSAELEALGARVAAGRFAAHMHVELVNDGPVTVTVDA